MASKPVPSGESLILLEKSAATMDEEQQMEMGYSQHLDDVSPNDAENPVEEDTAIVVENEKLPIGQYLRSGDFREIICCFIFGVLCMLTQYPGIPVNMRPIPFQYLENSAEYALNQVNAAEYTGDTVSNAAVTIIGFLAPLVLQFILSKTSIGRFGDAHSTVCVYFVSSALVALATNTIKSYVGYLRPVFYEKCEPDADFQECTGEDSLDARLSFPSGHSSLSFSGMTLLTCYLLARFGVYSGSAVLQQSPDGTVLMEYRKPEKIKKAFSILCLAPMAVACFVAASRVHDNMHFPADVLAGSMLGAVIAWFTHGVWFLAWPSI